VTSPPHSLVRSGPASATYVFCLVQSTRPPSLRGIPDSLPGAGAPRLLPIDGHLWAVVADAPLTRFSEEELHKDLHDLEAVSRHALAHAAVIEFFFRRSPVIPLKLFTLFSSDDRVRRDIGRRRPALRRLFAELRGLEEWGVRIVAGEAPSRPRMRAASGRAYLESKKRLTDEARSPAAAREIGAAMKQLGKLAVKTRKETMPPPGRGRSLVAGASFLVTAKRRSQWERLIRKLTAELGRHGHRLEVTGPWPPYHFTTR
jgi:hypothetical protein